MIFKNKEDVNLVLRKRYHRIQKYIVNVMVSNQQSIEACAANCVRNMAQVNLLGMNDRILLRIFDCFGVYELCDVAKTCVRFKQIADQSFATKFGKITMRAGNHKAEKVFRSFGHLIDTLDIDITVHEQYNFALLVRTCSRKLRNLNLWMNQRHPFSLDSDVLERLKLLFSNLQCLEIHCGEFFDQQTTMELLSSCSNLETLSIDCTSNSYDVWNRLSIPFQKLRELKFYLNLSLNDAGLGNLLASNRNINKLYLDECTRLTANAINIIVHFLPNLEELSLGLLQNIHPMYLQQLVRLRCLKNLVIILGAALPLIEIIRVSNIQIESLELWYVDITDAHIGSICGLQSIRKLVLSSNVQDSHLNILAANLSLLTEFHLGYSDLLTVDGLENMLFHAKRLTHLTLTHITKVRPSDKQRLLDFAERYLDKTDLTISFD